MSSQVTESSFVIIQLAFFSVGEWLCLMQHEYACVCRIIATIGSFAASTGFHLCSGILWVLLGYDPKDKLMIQGNVISWDIQGKCAGFSVCGDNDFSAIFFRPPATENEANDKAYNYNNTVEISHFYSFQIHGIVVCRTQSPAFSSYYSGNQDLISSMAQP